MYTFLLIILIIVSFAIIGAVLLQAGKGGGIAASFGGASTSSDSFIGSRQAGNLLTRISWWGGGLFLFLAFVLQLMSVRARAPRSILDQPLSGAAAPAAPVTGGSAPANVPVVPLPKDGKDGSPSAPVPIPKNP